MSPPSARRRRGGGDRRWTTHASRSIRAVATLVVLRRLARTRRAEDPIRALDSAARPSATTGDEPVAPAPHGSISVVVPARDEADRIGPLLDRVIGAPSVSEVIVVDDESTDETPVLAADAGATVVSGRPRPPGWAGKTWALQQGVDVATGDWIVTFDADTRPDPDLPAALVDRMLADGIDLLTVAGRFECPTRPARWLHAAMLTTLVYRFGAPGTPARPHRAMANGQCMAFRRATFVDSDGLAPVATEVVEDVALARRWASTGHVVAFLDASDLLRVRMFESLPDTWRGWSRSLALPGVEPLLRQVVDLALVALVQAGPLIRIVTRRHDVIDLVGLAVRLGTLAGTRSAFGRADAAYWLSPLADAAATAALADGIRRRGRQVWRGRAYG